MQTINFKPSYIICWWNKNKSYLKTQKNKCIYNYDCVSVNSSLALVWHCLSPVPWRCSTWIHGHLSFSAAVQALTRPFLLRRAKYGYHFCRPKRARWVDEAVICWLEIMPPSMPSGPEHSEEERGGKTVEPFQETCETVLCRHINFTNCGRPQFVTWVILFVHLSPQCIQRINILVYQK